VDRVAYLPDGRTILTTSDNESRLWSLAEGWEIRRVGRAPRRPLSVTRLPDGRVAVADVEGNSAVLWDLGGDREAGRFDHGGPVSCLALSADGRTLVTSGAGGLIRVWETGTCAELNHFEAGEAAASFTLAPDGRTILCWGGGGQVWDLLKTARMVCQLQRLEYSHSITSADFSPNSRLVVTGDTTYTGRAHLWDVASGREIHRLEFGANVTDVAFAPDGRRVFTGGVARSVLLWDISPGAKIKPGEPIKRFDHESEIKDIAVSPDGRTMVTSTFTTGDARVWDVESGRTLRRLEGAVDTIGFITISPDGRAILFDSSDPTRRVIERDTGRVIEQLPDRPGHRTCMEYQFTLGNRPGRTLRVWDAATGREVLRSRHAGEIAAVDLAPCGRKIVLVDDGRTARMLEADTRRVLTLEHGEGCRGAAFSPDGLHVVTQGPTAKLWDATSGQILREFIHEGVEIGSAEFSPDGKWLLTGGSMPRLWDVSGAREPVRLEHGEGCRAAQWSPDGRRALTLGPTAKLWEWDAGSVRLVHEFAQIVQTANGPFQVETTTATFSPDGHTLLTAGGGAAVWVWDAVTLPDDLVVLSFSGHGYTDARGALYLLPYDIGVGRTRVEDVLENCISTAELSAWLRGVDVGELAMVVDACHSAAAVQQPGFKPGPLGGRGLGQLAYDKGMRVLAASQADDVAVESYKIKQGLLSYALVRDGLEQRRSARDGVVTLGGLLAYAAERVPSLYREVLAGEVKDAAGAAAKNVGAVRPKVGQSSAVQRPELFDYERNKSDILLEGKIDGR
jgi:WD40 repeat protein